MESQSMQQGTALSSLAVVFAMLSFWPAAESSAETVRVAVASNFAPALEMLAKDFELISGHELQITQGSSGKQFAQISRGAPFDVFLSADLERPRMLREAGRVVALSAYRDDVLVYARGRLALWYRSGFSPPLAEAPPALEDLDFEHFAIANPRLAPYGLAANQLLEALTWSPFVAGKLVMGENIAQAYQYLHSGAAEIGLVAYSQILATDREFTAGQDYWLVPEELHSPIEQGLVVLRDTPAVFSFVDYLLSERAQDQIATRGYSKPSARSGG